jgi:glycosyltransferase involved in cell wall biosynthesis
VVHVCQPTEYGVPTVVLDHLAAQRAAGLDLVLICPPEGSLPERARALGIPVHPWDARREPGPSVVGETAALGRLLRRVQPDLVHLHSAKAGLAGRLAVRGRVATVFQPHAWSFQAARGVLGAAARRWERLGSRWADRIVCASEAEAAEGRTAGIHGDLVVVPNGADLTRFTPQSDADRRAARTRLGVPLDVPLAVCVGRLSPQKAQDVLMSAWSMVAADLPDARCVLVGEGPDRASLEAVAPPSVTFTGLVADPRDWYAAADVVVLPSRYEGNPLAVIEAMASSRCVVVSDVPSVREPLPVGSTAVAPVEDPAGLAQALLRRLTDPVRAAAEAAANLVHLRERHDVAATTARILALYDKVLSERRSSGPTTDQGFDAPTAT